MQGHFMHLRKYELFPLPFSCSPYQVSITRPPCPLPFLHLCFLIDSQSHLNNKQMASILNHTYVTHSNLVWLWVCTCMLLDRFSVLHGILHLGPPCQMDMGTEYFLKSSLESSFEAVNCCFLKPEEWRITPVSWGQTKVR